MAKFSLRRCLFNIYGCFLTLENLQDGEVYTVWFLNNFTSCIFNFKKEKLTCLNHFTTLNITIKG